MLSPSYKLDLTDVVNSSSKYITYPGDRKENSRLLLYAQVNWAQRMASSDRLNDAIKRLEEESGTDVLTSALQVAINNWLDKKKEPEE